VEYVACVEEIMVVKLSGKAHVEEMDIDGTI
jgi:hypothetical protein